MKCSLIFGMLVFACLRAEAQINTTTEQQIETLAEAQEEELEDDQYVQQLQTYKRHPLNVNSTSAAELAQLKMLNALQINSLLSYRRFFGPFLNLYELQAIPAWDVETIRKVLPFITVAETVVLKDELKTRLKGGEHIFLLRNSRMFQAAGSGAAYPGSNDHLLLRYKYIFKNTLQFGLTGDKDAGEQFFKGAQKGGFDFYSIHFFARNVGAVKSLALGDFTVNLGQGLLQWQSLAFKKGADVLNIKRQAPVLQPYSSAGEYAFNRGAGLTVQKGAWEATGFASFKHISGNRTIDTLSEEEAFSSFLISGLHRTPSEIKNRKNIRHLFFGGSATYKAGGFTAGFNAISHHFSKTLQKRNEPYNAFAIRGKHWTSASVDFSATFKNAHFFGEAALDQKQGEALISGLLIAIDPKVDFSVLYRNMAPQYQSISGAAFTESTSPSNEKGFYTGISIRPKYGIRIDAYADHYQFPFIKYRVDAPSKGQDYLLQLSYQPNKQVEAYARLKFEKKGINETFSDAALHPVQNVPRQSFRFHIIYRFTPVFTLKARTDAVWYNAKEQSAEEGFLIYTEVAYKLTQKASFNARLQYFETGGYNSRLYAYESDVLYGYSIPPFFGKGVRYYVNAAYDVTQRWSCWAKWAQTMYKDGRDTKAEIKLQVRYLF